MFGFLGGGKAGGKSTQVVDELLEVLNTSAAKEEVSDLVRDSFFRLGRFHLLCLHDCQTQLVKVPSILLVASKILSADERSI